jgi:hypothetical protein
LDIEQTPIVRIIAQAQGKADHCVFSVECEKDHPHQRILLEIRVFHQHIYQTPKAVLKNEREKPVKVFFWKTLGFWWKTLPKGFTQNL